MNLTNPNWKLLNTKPVLDDHSIDVWRAELKATEAELNQFLCLLSDDECLRADRFHFNRDRERFIIRRSILRKLIGQYLDIEPSAITFEYNEYGKPFLASDHVDQLQFNLSFSNDLLLLSFTRSLAIGIDIEIMNPDIMEDAIADRFFSNAETTVLNALPQEQQVTAFYNCWTRKEAWIKACGKGLSIPLDSFEVSLVPGEPARLLSTEAESVADDNWSMYELSPGPGYAAAVTVEGECELPRLFDWLLEAGQ